MKVLTFIALLAVTTTHAQALKEQLQGDWVCTKILDEKGNPTNGKFGEPNEYLRFSFDKNNLSITEAPFDRAGMGLPVTFYSNYVDVFPFAAYQLPERKYVVKSISEDHVVLQTRNDKDEPIEYHFLNQAKLKDAPRGDRLIDVGLIGIKRLVAANDGKRSRAGYEYGIENGVDQLYACPVFNDKRTLNFGSFVASNFIFPDDYPFGTASEELVLEFDLLDKQVSNVKIVQGLSESMNAAITRVVEKTNRKWETLEENGTPVKTTLRFHFVFYLGQDSL